MTWDLSGDGNGRARLQSAALGSDSRSTQIPRHVISVRTCKTNGQYKELFELVVTADFEVSIVSNPQISKFLPDINLFEFLAVHNCQLKELHGSIRSIRCQLSDLVLSSTDKIRFTKFEFLADRNPAWMTVGTLYRSEQPVFKC